MTRASVSSPLSEPAFPGDWLDEEDRTSVRVRHAAAVERWLDQASFASELFKLHEKYGIEQGDEGYHAYRGYLQQQYEKSLLTNGPTVDPLQEECDCLFCRFDPETISFRPANATVAEEVPLPELETLVDMAPEKQPVASAASRVDRRKQPAVSQQQIVHQPHSPRTGNGRRRPVAAANIPRPHAVPSPGMTTPTGCSSMLVPGDRHLPRSRSACPLSERGEFATRGPPERVQSG